MASLPIFTSLTKPEFLRNCHALNFIEKIILETKLTREEYKVKLIALLAFKVLGHYIFFFIMASRLKIWEVNCVPCHCTRMYPIALMCLCPLSGECIASFLHVLESSNRPPVPKPIRESQEPQSFCWLAVMPILALE